ncbi:MAG: transporter [Aquificae bacterium]|nr:transporter [Aquificota bacterium]
MKKLLTGGLSLSLIASAVFAGGYKVPEQSIRSTGTSGAYFSSSNSADASYYNPANMSFMKDGWGLETGIRYIVLPRIKFRGQVYDRVSSSYVPTKTSSNREDFLVPYFHYVSPKVGNLRFGLSITTPAGLSKSWENSLAQAYAKTFHLEVYETSLSASYLITDYLSVGAGLRAVYSRGEVELAHPSGAYSISMDGDTDILPGYVVSVSLKPTKELTISTLYRSKVDLRIKGNAKGHIYPGPYLFDTSGKVKVPLPAEWRLGASYRLGSTTFELTYERTFWSDYENLNFDFGDPTVEGAFGGVQPKDWDDTNTYRLGIIHDFNEKFTGMLGIAYDETPVPERNLGFELPDSDGWILSLGGIYKPQSKVEIGVAYLYFIKQDRTVNNSRIRGEFSDISAHMLTLSVAYGF